MASPVTLAWSPPDSAEVVSGEPVLGRTLVAMCGAVNHLNGLHARGWLPISVGQTGAETPAAAADRGLIQGEAENEAHRVPFYIPLGVDLLRVAVVALAYRTGGAAEPEVAVSAYESGGAVIDAGFTLTRQAGGLPGGEVVVEGDYLLTPFVGELANRTLSVGTKEGNVVILRLDTVRCMVIAAFVMPELAVTL
jgi:hypothetical protein